MTETTELNPRIAFEAGFRRSSGNGNLVREWRGRVVRVFRQHGAFHWSVRRTDTDGRAVTRYSGPFRYEEDATADLARELGIQP